MKIAGCVLAIAAFLGFRYYISQQYQHAIAAVTSGGPSSCIAMVGSTRTEENGHTYIVGTIRNNCGRTVGHVTVTFKVDRQSESAFHSDAPVYAYVNDIPAGETRTFRSMFQIAKDVGFRFDRIIAF
jgi:hypothetical protein